MGDLVMGVSRQLPAQEAEVLEPAYMHNRFFFRFFTTPVDKEKNPKKMKCLPALSE